MKHSRCTLIFVITILSLSISYHTLTQEIKLCMINVPKINNPLNISDRKIKNYLLEVSNDELNQVHYSQDVVFVDKDSDYNFVRLIGKYPIDIRYKNSPLTKEDAEKLPEKMDDDIKRAIVANSVKLETIE